MTHQRVGSLSAVLVSTIILLAWTKHATADDCALESTNASSLECTWDPDLLSFDYAVEANAATIKTKHPSDSLPAIASAIPDPSAVMPFAMSNSATAVTVRTGSAELRDFNSKLLQRKIDETARLRPTQFALPKPPPAAPSPVNLWTSFEVQGFDHTIEQKADQVTRRGVGADYKVDAATTLGISAETGDTRSTALASGQENKKIGAKVSVRTLPGVNIETQTQWERVNTGAFAESEASARETLSVAPRINRPFALDGGKTIEPFVSYKHEIASSAALDAAGNPITPTDTAGAGVTFAKPDAYSLSVTTGIEGIGAEAPSTVKSGIQLKLPLR